MSKGGGVMNETVYGPTRIGPVSNDKQPEPMEKEQKDEIILASAHWQYIESLLKIHGETDVIIAKCGHHYKTAFLHGWKHAKEDK